MSKAMDTVRRCQQRRRAALLLAILICAFMVATSPLRAENRAILVGVSEYPAASRAKSLQGPKNDVVLMHDVLRQRGFREEQIKILADHVPDPALAQTAIAPERANIMHALDDAAEQARPGDIIIISLSGHGSRQPAESNGIGADLHQDGRDEIFLPIDIGRWEQEIGSVKNAIVDREIAAITKRIRSRGAFVWLIIDACYSGHMDRAAGAGYVAARGVDPEDLGIPRINSTRPADQTREITWLNSQSGADLDRSGIVAFLAAQEDQKAVEAAFPRLPSESTQRRQIDGMLTFYLAVALARHPTATFMDLAQAVIAGYAAWNRGDRPIGLWDLSPVPVITGELDRSVDGKAVSVKYWDAKPILSSDENSPVTEIEIFAGRLHGLTPGRKVKIRELATNEEVAAAEVTQVFAVTARARIEVSLDDKKSEVLRRIAEDIRHPTGAQPILVVDPLSPIMNFDLTVALPRPTTDGDGQAAQALVADAIRNYQTKDDFDKMAMLDFIAPDQAETGRLTVPPPVVATNPIVADNASLPVKGIALQQAAANIPRADIYLKIWNGRLWLLTSPDEFRPEGISPYGHMKTPSLAIGNDAAALERELESMLRKVAKAQNLLAVASEIAGSAASHDLDAQLFVLRAPTAVAGTAPARNAAASPYPACQPTPRGVVPRDAERIDIGQPLTVGHCDTVYLQVSNSGTLPIDLTILDVTADDGIYLPKNADSLRIQPKGIPVVISYQLVAWDVRDNKPLTVGPERLVLLGVQRQANEDGGAAPLNYASLFIQNGIGTPEYGLENRTRGPKAAARSSSIADLALNDLLDGAASVGGTRDSAAENAASLENAFAIIIQWDMRVLP